MQNPCIRNIHSSNVRFAVYKRGDMSPLLPRDVFVCKLLGAIIFIVTIPLGENRSILQSNSLMKQKGILKLCLRKQNGLSL